MTTEVMHHLWIPEHGSLELIETDLAAEVVMSQRTEGTVVRLGFVVDERKGRMVFCVDNPLHARNVRAKNALVWLCGAHMEFDGPVILTEIDPVLLAELVRDIG